MRYLKVCAAEVVNNHSAPSFTEEKLLESQGYRLVAGVDEVGRGALAGPVMAAAVILPCGVQAEWLDTVRDSKQLTPTRRELLSDCIQEVAVSIGIGMVDNGLIDSQGIVKATRLAMKSAIEQLSPSPQHLLIDYMSLSEVPLPQKGIVGGDGLCISIACASIVAKVARDRLMVQFDCLYPDYGLAKHKGYGTREHIDCVRKLGLSPIHRRSFRPLRI